MTLQVRQILPRDAPSVLFYYIFDDWYSAYNLVAQKGHQYELQLEQLVRHWVVRSQLAFTYHL